MNVLSVGSIVSNAFKLGFNYLFSVIGALVLWLITLWIPYINVGTTIGIIALVPAMSKGEAISPTQIFDKKYRKYLGEFFLAVAFINLGIIIGYLFVIIPGIVISIAWCLALYLLIDHDMAVMEAIKTSNNLTYGKKWTILFGVLLVTIIVGAIVALLMFIGQQFSEILEIVLVVIGYLFALPISLGAYAHIYDVLTADLDGGSEAETPAY